jgi:membrane protease YdiL (CAAX protease family)
MTTLVESIRRHQLIAFFVLAYAISWVLWIPLILFPGELLEVIGLIGVLGPALACIILLTVIARGPKQGRSKTRWSAFIVAWIAATIIFILHVISPSPSDNLPIVVVISAVVALPPAFVVLTAFSGMPDVRNGLASLVKPSGGLGWYLVAVLIEPAVRLLSVAITPILGWKLLSEPIQTSGGLELTGLVVVSFLYTFVFAGGLNEETGWTGFALSRLQAQHNPLIASVILWFFWTLWHLPLQLAGYWNPNIEALIHALIGTFFARFIFTWLYNRTNGGILTAVLLHTSANVASEFIPVTYALLILEAVVAIIVIVTDRMWRKLPTDSPAVYRATEQTT